MQMPHRVHPVQLLGAASIHIPGVIENIVRSTKSEYWSHLSHAEESLGSSRPLAGNLERWQCVGSGTVLHHTEDTELVSTRT